MRPRRGFALAAALLSLMLIAALVASVFFAAMEETKIGSASAAAQLALAAAESAIEVTLADYSNLAGEGIGIGGTRSSMVDGFGTPVSVSVTRLDSTLYWIVADAGSLSSEPSPTKRIGAFVGVHIASDHSITIDRIPDRWWSEVF